MNDFTVRRVARGGLGFASLLALAACAHQASKPVAAVPAEPVRHGLQSVAELDGKAPAGRTLAIQTWQTAEGAKVLFVEAHELPMFDLHLTFAAGSSQDQNSPGLAMLTNAMLDEGVAGKNVGAIAESFEGLGAEYDNGAYRDMAVASLRSLSAADKREPAVQLFTQVIGHPTFPADSLVRLKNQLLAGFADDQQDPGRLGNLALNNRLFGNHPYAHPADGNPQSVPRIDLAQIRAFHAKAYTASNTVIALVGDLSSEQAHAMAAQVSAVLPRGPALPPLGQPQKPAPGITHIEFATKQTRLILAELGIDRADPDYAALSMGNQILGGGGFGTRLMTEVREKRGLTYGVSSSFTPMQVRGPFTIDLQTRAELTDGTLKLVQQVLRDYLASGPTQKELDDAKRELAGSFPLSTASNEDIVGQLGAIGFYHLPLSFLQDFMQQAQALTVDQVKTAMNKHLNANDLVIVTVGPSVAQKPLPPPSDHPVEPTLGVPEH